MGNLADELADAFSEYGEDDEVNEDTHDGIEGDSVADGQNGHEAAADGARDSGVDVNGGLNKDSLSVLSPPRKGHPRKASDYDGSEYGSESDLDASGMPPSLVAKIDAVESLARRGTENYGGSEDEVFNRVTEGLRDLGSQSSVEGSASR